MAFNVYSGFSLEPMKYVRGANEIHQKDRKNNGNKVENPSFAGGYFFVFCK
jgi:hypothetical protein